MRQWAAVRKGHAQRKDIPMLVPPAGVVFDGNESPEAQLALVDFDALVFALLVLAAGTPVRRQLCRICELVLARTADAHDLRKIGRAHV